LKTRTVHVRIEESLLNEIDSWAKLLNMTRSELIRIAIKSLIGWFKDLQEETLATYYLNILINLSTRGKSENE